MQNSDLHVGGGLAQSFSAINDAKPTREPYLHPSHSPRTTDDSHNTQHISPHLLQLGWLQPKQPQTKHKSTSTPFVSHSLGLRFKNLQSSSKGKWCKKTKQNNGLSAFFDEQRLYKICSEGLLHIYPLFWRANGSGQILVQHLLLKTLKNNTESWKVGILSGVSEMSVLLEKPCLSARWSKLLVPLDLLCPFICPAGGRRSQSQHRFTQS